MILSTSKKKKKKKTKLEYKVSNVKRGSMLVKKQTKTLAKEKKNR